MSKAQSPDVPTSVQVLDPERLDKYRGGAHVLISQAKIAQISPMFQVRLERVDLSPNPDDRDIFQLPGTYNDPKYGLSARGLYKLARAAGIQLAGADIKTATQSYVLAQAKVKKRNESGEWIWAEGSYELDLEIVEEDLYADYAAKFERAQKNPRGKGADYAPKSDEECRQKARTGAMKIRRYKVQRAETGAYCRAIRAMLGISGEFRQEDFKKPFIVAAVHFAPDMTDPAMRELVGNAAALSIARGWGGPGEVKALEEKTGKTVAELEADQQMLRLIENGPPGADEIEFVEYELLDDDARMEAAVRNATPAHVNLEEA